MPKLSAWALLLLTSCSSLSTRNPTAEATVPKEKFKLVDGREINCGPTPALPLPKIAELAEAESDDFTAARIRLEHVGIDYDFGSTYPPWWERLNPEERIALYSYKGGGFGELNRKLRLPEEPLKFPHFFQLLCSALYKLPLHPENVPLYRGTLTSRKKANEVYREGSTHTERAFLSTTRASEIAKGFLQKQGMWEVSDGVQIFFDIRARSGRVIEKDHEEEVLFPAGSRFRVKGVDKTRERTFPEFEFWFVELVEE